MEKKINYEFKVLSAIGIFLVTCGHFGSPLLSFGELYSYDTFHIPLFIFISGYFYKEYNHKNIKNVLAYAKKKTLHLFVPYVLWNLAYGVFAFVFQTYINPEFKICKDSAFELKNIILQPFKLSSGFIYNVASWFLMALFIIEILNVLIRFVFDKIKIGNCEPLVLAFYFVIAFFAVKLAVSGFESEWKILFTRTGYLIFYYELGCAYNRFIEKYDEKINDILYLTINILLSYLCIHFFSNIIPVCYNMTGFSSAPTAYYFLRAFLGIAFWLRIAKILSVRIGKNKLLLFTADHTFSLMMHQGIVGLLINVFLLKFRDDEFYVRVHNDIWANNSIIVTPIIVCAVILALVYLFELIKRKIKVKTSAKA